MSSNFRLVSIAGFDQLFAEELWPRILSNQPTPTVRFALGGKVADQSPTFDMRPLEGLSVDDLEWTGLRDRIASYCRALDLNVPEHPDRAWVTAQLIRQNLATEVDGSARPTVAGYLLFARSPHHAVQPFGRTRHAQEYF